MAENDVFAIEDAVTANVYDESLFNNNIAIVVSDPAFRVPPEPEHLTADSSPPTDTGTEPDARPMNERERRLRILRRTDYWHAVCAGIFSFIGVLCICMGLIVVKLPLEPVVRVRPAVAILADTIFVVLGLTGLLSCTFSFVLIKSSLYL